MMRISRLLILLTWLCFIARGLFYGALFPLWEGYDEPYLFAFLEHVIAYLKLPVRTDPVSREVQASLHLLPLSWEQRLHAITPPLYTEDTYWQLPGTNRDALEGQLRAIPTAWSAELGTGPLLYEAQHPPIYYLLFSIPLRPAWGVVAGACDADPCARHYVGFRLHTNWLRCSEMIPRR